MNENEPGKRRLPTEGLHAPFFGVIVLYRIYSYISDADLLSEG